MILKALYDYYFNDQQVGGEMSLPPYGLQTQKFSCLLVIEKDGTFNRFEDGENSEEIVPLGVVGRTNQNDKPNLLWDSGKFVLGIPKKNAKKQSEAEICNKAFVARLENLPELLKNDEGVNAVLEFYRRGEHLRLQNGSDWENVWREKCEKSITFQLNGDMTPVPCRPAVLDYAKKLFWEMQTDDRMGICSVTGERNCILARFVEWTSIPYAGNSALVSFNQEGCDSYGKKKCYNASISKKAAFASMASLKELMKFKSRHCFQFNDCAEDNLYLVFWLKEDSSVPIPIKTILSGGDEGDLVALRDMCESPQTARLPPGTKLDSTLPVEDREKHYYFLALSKNEGRLIVRIWRTGTIDVLIKNFALHFDDLKIIGEKNDGCFPLIKLLEAAVRKKDASLHSQKRNRIKEPDFQFEAKDAPRHLEEQMLTAIFDGKAYPEKLLLLCLQRIRSERNAFTKRRGLEHSKMVKQWEIESLWRTRAALIKAYLNRKMRDGKINNEKEIKMAYDPENRNEAYQCGALFAVLEKAQEDANRVNAKDTDDNSPLNATIGDRFFAAASKRPAAIFPRLLEQYKTAYVRKIRRDNISKSVYFDKMICELEAKLTPSGYPSNLKIDDQGRFTIGYYHKKAELYESKENKQKINEQPLNEQGE